MRVSSLHKHPMSGPAWMAVGVAALVVIGVTLAAALTHEWAMAQGLDGALLTAAAVLAAIRLVRAASVEDDPNRLLAIDLRLILAVVLFLIGIGVLGEGLT